MDDVIDLDAARAARALIPTSAHVSDATRWGVFIKEPPREVVLVAAHIIGGEMPMFALSREDARALAKMLLDAAGE